MKWPTTEIKAYRHFASRCRGQYATQQGGDLAPSLGGRPKFLMTFF